MNPIRKMYCRTFQGAFHIALPFLPYRQPKMIDSITAIPSILMKKHKERVMIVTDEGIRKLGLVHSLEEALQKNGIFYVIYDKTVPNPTTLNVEEARQLYKENRCKALIGFGGGSSIDCAKAVGARIARPRKSPGQMAGILRVRKKLPLFIAIPTTAGTGSETTLAAVITDAQTRHKYAINDFPLIPGYAVLDPQITVSLPPFITATTGMDALTHAVEAYIGNSTTRATRAYALRAVKLIFQNLDRAYQKGSDLRARKNMLIASYYAGCAFTQSYVGYVHAVAHSIGGQYDVPHGLANAILLPHVLKAYGKRIDRKLHRLAVAAGVASEDTPAETAAKDFIHAIEEMKKRFHIGDTVKEIREEDIPKLARYADKEANPLYPVPVLMDSNELKLFYYILLEDQSSRQTV
ncbi:MAG: iron-containing alcohol dehydrogenase [Eubacteriales bacterium]|nr:iron-containing alcohol dehydrogenase [Eubacteriales bacterium]